MKLFKSVGVVAVMVSLIPVAAMADSKVAGDSNSYTVTVKDGKYASSFETMARAKLVPFSNVTNITYMGMGPNGSTVTNTFSPGVSGVVGVLSSPQHKQVVHLKVMASHLISLNPKQVGENNDVDFPDFTTVSMDSYVSLRPGQTKTLTMQGANSKPVTITIARH